MFGKKPIPNNTAADNTWYASLPRSTRFPTIAGAVIMGTMAAGFGVWGNMAP